MAGKKTDAKKTTALSKSALLNAVVEASGDVEVSRKQVKAIFDALVTLGHRELKKNGLFTVPGFAKFRVVKKPATKAREGVNPFTGQKMMFKAKPASKKVRAVAMKSLKSMVN